MEWIAALLLGYLLGSLPFGVILTRLTGAGDLRAIGSGNIGATNVLRTGRKSLAAATLLLDTGKGALAVWLASRVFAGPDVPAADIAALAGLAVVLGHCFPVWLGFRGGKGVATLMGVALGFAPILGLAFAAVWIAVLVVTRVSSLGGMSAAVCTPLAALALGVARGNQLPALVVLALLVLWNHRANIARLRCGTEPRIGGGGGRPA